MSSAPQVPGVELGGKWREGYEQALADDVVELRTLPAPERLA